jgi:hypothetical protein
MKSIVFSNASRLPAIYGSLLFLAATVNLGCQDRELRGKVTPSNDGTTYLAILDDNGGGCGPLIVDGKPWPYKIGEKGPIKPGDHRIECGNFIIVNVKQGTTFSFDYWGP